ncbi:hypothetical protein PVAP13_1NG560701 [Panicum virgatum]|uniref:Secreted protein n=1 Tax=Panicum virgatum TaxID=38727 RepID=A0A8T0WZF4_PANVG|nr:hypothetical protein PVAP13_1NG560701 [Panicum virgatum]
MNLVFLLLYFYVPKLRGKRCLSMLFHILDVNPYCFECRIMPCVVSCHPIYRINSTSACVMLCYVYCYDFCDSDDEWWCMILLFEKLRMRICNGHSVSVKSLSDVHL